MKTELYSIIKSPYLTEKVSTLMGESNQYAFKVDINATKLQVKKAIEGYFSVDVEDVNIIKVKGKTKRSSCLLYTSPSPRDRSLSRMPSSA